MEQRYKVPLSDLTRAVDALLNDFDGTQNLADIDSDLNFFREDLLFPLRPSARGQSLERLRGAAVAYAPQVEHAHMPEPMPSLKQTEWEARKREAPTNDPTSESIAARPAQGHGIQCGQPARALRWRAAEWEWHQDD